MIGFVGLFVAGDMLCIYQLCATFRLIFLGKRFYIYFLFKILPFMMNLYKTK